MICRHFLPMKVCGVKFYPTNHDDDHDGRRLTDNYPFASNGRLKPITASGYIWVLLEQDKDRIES